MPPFFEGALIDTVQLSVEQTVPRSLVHKRSHENVLLTETRAAGDDRFLCAGRIPTAHQFFNGPGRTPQRDILFYTELGRQASLAISHAYLGVSQDDVFIFEGSEATVTDTAWTNAALLAQDAVAVEVRVRETARRRNGAVSRVVADHLMCIDGQPVFYGTGAWTVQPAALFQRLRRTSATRSAASAAGVASDRGRGAARPSPVDNVVISTLEPASESSAFAAALVVDDRHPYFFDHPCDHVPGMLLLEGCAQLAMAACTEAPEPPAGLAAYGVNFAQFVECGIPAILEAQVHSTPATDGAPAPATVTVTISQAGAVAGTATVRLASAI